MRALRQDDRDATVRRKYDTPVGTAYNDAHAASFRVHAADATLMRRGCARRLSLHCSAVYPPLRNTDKKRPAPGAGEIFRLRSDLLARPSAVLRPPIVGPTSTPRADGGVRLCMRFLKLYVRLQPMAWAAYYNSSRYIHVCPNDREPPLVTVDSRL
jgi:hypothetical protein